MPAHWGFAADELSVKSDLHIAEHRLLKTPTSLRMVRLCSMEEAFRGPAG